MIKSGTTIGLSLVLAVFLAISTTHPASALYCGYAQPHSATFGRRIAGDEMVHFEHPKISGRYGSVVTYNVNYPAPHDPPGNVTFIEAYDQYRNGSGGCLYLSRGGIGKPVATLTLTSQRGYGLDFVVRMYGKRRWRK